MKVAFSKEIKQRIVAQIMPNDMRYSDRVREVQQAMAELDQGLPDLAIKILEAKGRELGKVRHEIDELISSFGVDEKLNLAPSEAEGQRLVRDFFKPHISK